MKKTKWLALLLAVTVAGCCTIFWSAKSAPVPEYALMLAAAERTGRAYQAVYERRLELGIPPDPKDDPNETGLIGPLFTGITTTQGLLEAKRTTTNPNSGALLVCLLLEAGVQPGDTVAVNLSGSFPAVNIALLCALEEMDVTGVIFSSIGASTHGATLPQLTYPDMELLLYEKGIISQRSAYVSMGGRRDLGLDMDPELVSEIRQRLESAGVRFLSFSETGENLDFRFQYYLDYDISCFVNIGGNLLSFGGSSLMSYIGGGVITRLPGGESGDGLVQRFLAEKIPVVHMLGMKDLYTRYGLPIDPVPLPEAGSGGLYFHRVYSPAVFLFLAADALILWKLWRITHPKKRDTPGNMHL